MRSKFVNTGLIPVSEILLDQNNYRLGPLDNQLECIDMMFEVFGPKITKLAGHLAQEGISPKPVVVSKDGEERWIVRDGNRRVTALKVLNNPSMAPTDYYKRTFQSLKDKAINIIPDKLDCLTADESTIAKYRELEHMGEQEGIGQIPWGAPEKQNLMVDTSGKLGYPHAMALRQYLQKKGVAEALIAPVTNIQRLFEDNDVSRRIGMEWDGNDSQFIFNASEEEVLDILKAIFIDFSKRDSTGRKRGVKDIYYKENRKAYLDELFGSRDFKIPTPSNDSPTFTGATTAKGSTISGKPITQANIPVRIKPPWDRKRLIQRGQGLPTPNTEIKLNTILVELASKIDYREATVATAVLIRLIVERSVEFYSTNNNVTLYDNDNLHTRIKKVAKKMAELKAIDKNQLNQLKRMSDGEELLSANTLNSWVHASKYTPVPREVCEFWDNIRYFLVKCWK